MNLIIFFKYFLGFFLLSSVLFIAFNMIIWHKSWDQIDHILNLFSATIISLIVGISKARE
ncbi:hypothetical protein CXK86_25040 [Paenibacillus sp. BGI2013]|nr:hypothetical protein EL84_27790 [Paenibacillus sp. VT-400]OMF06571.1 hypothetical protein BK129_12985 [Paenibacillus amylolyticus]OMF45046.1 hypothetical protein BK136_07910 [Paenibacillus amylolyticus]PKQ88296.1 hypothetical protein CXK86_25040 [Paenibacillus sp. BGI2013]